MSRIDGVVISVDGKLWSYSATLDRSGATGYEFKFPFELPTTYWPTFKDVPDDGAHSVMLVSIICPSWGTFWHWVDQWEAHPNGPSDDFEKNGDGPLQPGDVLAESKQPLTLDGRGHMWCKLR